MKKLTITLLFPVLVFLAAAAITMPRIIANLPESTATTNLATARIPEGTNWIITFKPETNGDVVVQILAETGEGSTNLAPSIAITSPTSGAQFTEPVNLLISANATDPDGTVARVIFYSSQIPIKTSTVAPFSFILTNAPPKAYVLTAQAQDNLGATALSTPVQVTVNPKILPTNGPPDVNLSTPLNGAVYTSPATVPVAANATDDEGTIASVKFFNNGALLATDTTAPYTTTLTNLGNGSYRIHAQATDNNGATTLSDTNTISVTTSLVATTNKFLWRLVFYRARLTSSTDRDRLIGIMRRAAAVGYNGIALQEDGCLKSPSPDTTCMNNLNTIKTEATKLGLLLIPYSFSQAEPVSTSSVDIREAFPSETKFVVSGALAKAVGDPPASLANPGFESYVGNKPTSWSADLPGTVSFIDTNIHHSGSASLRIQDPVNNPSSGKARVFQQVSVVPGHSYLYSIWIRTENFSDPSAIGFLVVGANNGRYLLQNRDWRLGVPPPAKTQTWTKYEIDFNPLENSSVYIYINATSKATGKVWYDDASLEEVGLYSTVRRPSTPIIVKSYDKTILYREGTDYIVGDRQLSIPTGSLIKSGMALKVSWFQLCNMYESWSIPGTATAPEFFAELKKNAITISQRLAVKSWFVRYDEWRVMYDPNMWNVTAGQYLATTMTKTEDLIKSISPSIVVLVWNDMFDKYHNAVDLYFGVRSSLRGSWNGVNQKTIIMNWWNAGNTSNMKFWSGLDAADPIPPHLQILCLYYEGLPNVATWLRLLDQAEIEGVRGVIGCMYTTWSADAAGLTGRYTDLEAVADMIKAEGRWGSGPIPFEADEPELQLESRDYEQPDGPADLRHRGEIDALDILSFPE